MKNEAWDELRTKYQEYTSLAGDFLSNEGAVSVVRQKLNSRPEDIIVAIDIIRRLPGTQRVLFFDQLMLMASYMSGFTGYCHDLILELPRGWVMENIDRHLDAILSSGDYDTYNCLLALCEKLDSKLTIQSAQRAQHSTDDDIRDLGSRILQEQVM